MLLTVVFGKDYPPLFKGGTFWSWSLSFGVASEFLSFCTSVLLSLLHTLSGYGAFSAIVVLLELH